VRRSRVRRVDAVPDSYRSAATGAVIHRAWTIALSASNGAAVDL
jgi:hypothetical protein